MKRVLLKDVYDLIENSKAPVITAETALRCASDKERLFIFSVPGRTNGIPTPQHRKDRDIAKGLYTAWDENLQEYRCIALTSTQYLNIDGEKIVIDHRQ